MSDTPLPPLPQSREDWLKWLDYDCAFAVKMLVDTGSVSPQLIIHRRDGKMSVVLTPFADAEEKSLVKKFMRLMCISEEAAGATFMNEAWMTTMPVRPEESFDDALERARSEVPPSQSSSRIEVLLVFLVYYDENGHRRCATKVGEILRDETGAATGTATMDLTEDKDTGGSMLDIFTRERPGPEMVARAKEAFARMTNEGAVVKQ